MNDVDKLFERLKKINEAQGYYFNRDHERVCELLAALMVNRRRYGYMSCPCRLAADDREHDRDIICPCEYRAPDVAEYGSCYCNLYVSREWNDEQIKHQHVPERRPPTKLPL